MHVNLDTGYVHVIDTSELSANINSCTFCLCFYHVFVEQNQSGGLKRPLAEASSGCSLQGRHTAWLIAVLLAVLCVSVSAQEESSVEGVTGLGKRLQQRFNTSKSDDFFSVIKKAKDIDKNCKTSTGVCKEACLKSPGSLDIKYDEFRFHAEFAVENGQLLSTLISRLPFDGIWHRSERSLANGNCSGSSYVNFFSGGNTLFLTRGRSSAQTDNVYAVGGCLGNGIFNDSECFYYRRRNTTDGSDEEIDDPNAYKLSYFTENMGSDPPWFETPRIWIDRQLGGAVGNKSWVGGPCQQYCPGNDSRLDQLSHCYIPENLTCPVLTRYSEDLWIEPYFDCELGHIWMITYAAPVSVYQNGTVYYLGMTGVDIELDRIKINQCSLESSGIGNVFANTHLCDSDTSTCQVQNVSGLQLRRGLYNCVCKDGYYNATEISGEMLENIATDWRKKHTDSYGVVSVSALGDLTKDLVKHQCKPCEHRCKTCTSASDDCRYESSKVAMAVLHTINGAATIALVLLLVYVLRKRQESAIRSASWQFLVVILSGALLAYVGLFISAFPTSRSTCTVYFWLDEIGFTLSYGSILLKSWRIEQIFSNKTMSRPRKRTRLQNQDLALYLILLLGLCALIQSSATASGRLNTKEGQTDQSLYYDVCTQGVFAYIHLFFHLLVLLPSTYLCFKLRRVLTDYAESREISVIVYFTVLIEIVAFVSTTVLSDIIPEYWYSIRSLTAMFVFTIMCGILFFPKIRKVQWPTKEEIEAAKGGGRQMTLLRGSTSSSMLRRRGTVSLDLYHRDSILDSSQLPSEATSSVVRYHRRGSRDQSLAMGSFGSMASRSSRFSISSRSSTDGALRLGSVSSNVESHLVRSPGMRTQRSQSLAIPGATDLLAHSVRSASLTSPLSLIPSESNTIIEEDRPLSPDSCGSNTSQEVVIFPSYLGVPASGAPPRRRSASDADDAMARKRVLPHRKEEKKRCSDLVEKDEASSPPKLQVPSITVLAASPVLRYR